MRVTVIREEPQPRPEHPIKSLIIEIPGDRVEEFVEMLWRSKQWISGDIFAGLPDEFRDMSCFDKWGLPANG